MSHESGEDVLAAFVREQVGLRFGNVAHLLRDFAQDEVPHHVREGLVAVALYIQRTSEAATDLVCGPPEIRPGVRKFLFDALSQEARPAARR